MIDMKGDLLTYGNLENLLKSRENNQEDFSDLEKIYTDIEQKYLNYCKLQENKTDNEHNIEIISEENDKSIEEKIKSFEF